MKIAFVVPYVPNLIRTRPYNLILHLVAQGHQVEVFTLGSGKRDELDAQALRNKGAVVHYFNHPIWRSFLNSALTVPTRQPLQSVYSWHGGLSQQLVAQVAQQAFDIVHVEHLRGSRFGLYIRSKIPAQAVVWDSVDCISHLFEQASSQSRSLFGRFMTRFELPRTKKAEAQLICAFDHALVTSVVDREALLGLVSNGQKTAPLSVLPNGVDLEYFQPNPAIQRDTDAIVFSGKMSYHANISMVKYLVTEIMPLVWKARLGAKLFIVGKDPSAEIVEFGRDPRITVTGTVDDIRPYLWRAAVSVVPLLYGAGIQNKILEAMATGTPVITTSRTLSALSALPGGEVLVADTPEAFAAALLSVMENESERTALGQAGMDYVHKHHDWKIITERLVSIYQSAQLAKADA